MKDKFMLTRGMIILLFIIILVIVGIVFGLGIIKDNSIDKYKEYELELKEETKNYYSIYYLNKGKKLLENEQKKITMKTLIKNDMLFDTQDVVKECNGFVIMTNDPSLENNKKYEVNYEAYIKCGNKYKTPGYELY